MRNRLRRSMIACVTLSVAGVACALPTTGSGPDTAGTMVAATIYVLQTNAAATQTAFVVEIPTSAATPMPTITSTPSITPTPQNPVVTALALCMTGPGSAYRVVSSIKEGTRVELLGVGSIPGWFVIQNPVYNQRCWIPSTSLKLDPAVNTQALRVYNPPPTPGPKYTATPTP